jgi:protein subunit release factor B
MVSKEKWQRLQAWMASLAICEEDLSEQFIIGSGRGGQNLHKTASTVLLNHQKSNSQIKCQHSRSQETNRYYARLRLCEKIDSQLNQEKSKRQREIDKIRKQKKRRRKRHKDIQDKKHQATVKKLRKKPSS